MRKVSNIQNFLGDFQFNKQYKKFDFVYNPVDGLFYYAKKDNFVANFEIQDSDSNRFSLIADGPVYDGRKAHYLIDSLNDMSEYTQGQTIKIEGSNAGNDGDYKIIEINNNQFNSYHDVNHQLIDVLDATQIEEGRFEAGWFLFWDNAKETFDWNVDNSSLDFRAYVENDSDLYNDYIEYYIDKAKEEYSIVREISYPPQFSEDDPQGGYYLVTSTTEEYNHRLYYVIMRSLGTRALTKTGMHSLVASPYQWIEDWGEDHYTTTGKNEGRIVPLKENANFFRSDSLGDISYNIVNPETKALWFNLNSLFEETTYRNLVTLNNESRQEIYEQVSPSFNNRSGALHFFTKKSWVSGAAAVLKFKDLETEDSLRSFGKGRESGFVYARRYWGNLILWDVGAEWGYDMHKLEMSPEKNILTRLTSEEKNDIRDDIERGGTALYDDDGNLIPPVEYDPNDPDLSIAFDSSLYSTHLTIQGVSGQDAVLNNESQDPNNTITISQAAPAVGYDISNATEDWAADEFFFDADYGSSVEFSCDTIKYQYGNGYYINQPRGINSLNAKINLKFKNRSNRESSALVHFVENHLGQSEKQKSSNNINSTRGIKGFKWGEGSVFFPYKTNDIDSKQFFCLDYSHSLNFQDSNDVSVSLINHDTSILNKSENLYISGSKTYNDSENYYRNDVVFIPDSHQYYYCVADGPIVGQNPEVSVEYWSRDFVWSPSLGLKIDQSPRLNSISFGSDYTQVYRDGINEKLLNLNLEFSGRNDNEARAILHFLEHHYGCIPFKFFAPAPYNESKNFVCNTWTHTYEFNNNHNISAQFEQFPFDLEAEDYQFIDSVQDPDLGEYNFQIADFLNMSSN